MPRWLWWAPFGILVLGTGLLGLRWGWIAAHTTEADVINRYAQKYIEDRTRDGTGQGAEPTDCVAYPGEDPGIWLSVVCGPDPKDLSRSYEYQVDRLGQFVRGWSPHSEGIIPGQIQRPHT